MAADTVRRGAREAAEPTIAPGAQVEIRDAVWRVVKVTPTFNGTRAFHVVGVSEIVRDQDAVFLEEYERDAAGKLDVKVLDPRETQVVQDDSQRHLAGRLYMEALLRDVPPTTDELHVGHRAAMDVLDFQLEPARRALQQLRARLLIADAVGLGKTLEAGILLSELIRRGRARRILVVAVKSMLAQFQKELWTRFSIPLVRLDSRGLARIRQQLPTNQNPFHSIDRAIISIDTLKEQGWFRAHVEKARWDVIVIDEAHNVAERGRGRSLRSRLAHVLADRADNLIMLSATPHDGKAPSFASLMNMLDPTAIADPNNYGPDDIRGLYIRRFKKDVQDQVRQSFPERSVYEKWADASAAEERAYEALGELEFVRIDQRTKRKPGHLFKTTLEKALLSSPMACAETIKNRLQRFCAREDAEEFAEDVRRLQQLQKLVLEIEADQFSKYQHLLRLLKDKKGDMYWSRKKDDRLVVFTESIATLKFLQEQLRKDLGLDKKPAKGKKPVHEVEIIHGGLPDLEIQRIVEEFGKEKSKLKLLIASDVASEGINLHYLCHTLIHFDVPWSLMKFRQRNGRIDRYGQTRPPRIAYLLTNAQEEGIRGDHRILEKLIERDQQATENIGDPSAFLGVYDADQEEEKTAEAIENKLEPDAFVDQFNLADVDPLELLLSQASLPAPPSPSSPRECLSLFSSDFAFFTAALDLLRHSKEVTAKVDEAEQRVELTLPPDLRRRYRRFPEEIRPDDGVVVLSANRQRIQEAIQASRAEEEAWPRVQYLWALHPALAWAADKARFRFGRHQAPAVHVRPSKGGIAAGERVVVVSALLPNQRSEPLYHRWFGVVFQGETLARVEDFQELVERLKLTDRDLVNPGDAPLESLQALVPPAVEAVVEAAKEAQVELQARLDTRLEEETKRLGALRGRQLAQLEETFRDRRGERAEHERKAGKRRIERRFRSFEEWVRSAMKTEPAPFVQVIAVLWANG